MNRDATDRGISAEAAVVTDSIVNAFHLAMVEEEAREVVLVLVRDLIERERLASIEHATEMLAHLRRGTLPVILVMSGVGMLVGFASGYAIWGLS
jgi:50S ribosomal subunit-associated GTPase HflX